MHRIGVILKTEQHRLFLFFQMQVKLGERCHTVFASDFKEFPKSTFKCFRFICLCYSKSAAKKTVTHPEKRVNFTKTFESGPEDGFRPRLRELTAAG